MPQQALRVDEVKSFFEEGLEHLEGVCAQEVFQQDIDTYGSLMQAIHGRFKHFQDDHQTLQHNASVLLKAAQEYCDAIREEFRHQIQEPLAGFQREIERLLESYATKTQPVSIVR